MADPPVLSPDAATVWFTDQIPSDWFSEIQVLLDRDEIMVSGTLPPAEAGAGAGELDGQQEQTELNSIEWFREETRSERVGIAQRAESKFRRKVSWAARSGSTQDVFTHQSVPVMTRLRITERQVLDTLVSAGVARSRSDALAWCVRLVGEHKGDWLAELREAIGSVDQVRSKGPA